MQDQLVSFETAKLAKDKKFIFYGRDSACYLMNGQSFPSTYNLQNYDAAVAREFSKFIYAPTQSLLQRWLREVHKIEAGVNYNYYQVAGKITYQKIVISNNYLNYRCTGSFNSYEEAFEESLKEALKLIK